MYQGIGKLLTHPNIYLSIYLRRAYDKFPEFFRMGTFIDSTDMKL